MTQVATVRQTLGDETSRSGSTPTAPGASTTPPIGLEALARHEIELAEQPVGTFEQMVDLRRRVEVRIAADESLVSPFDARRARELGACDVAAVKVAKVGGLGAALEIARDDARRTCRARWRVPSGSRPRLTPCRLCGSSGGDAGVAHGLATERLFSTTVGRRRRLPSAMSSVSASGPGLGVEIDEDALAARRLD